MQLDTSAKEKIFQAAFELVKSEESTENITSRQIAKKADVNLALINYYFQSKENLLSQVVEMKMADIIKQIFRQDKEHTDPVKKLKNLLAATADYSFKHNQIFKIAVNRELKEGCRNSCELVMPFLRDIFKTKNESELRIIALQLMLPFHYIVLYPKKYNDYLDTDFFDDQHRTEKINQMVDSILKMKKSNQAD
jgi:AcrR family transcriptional regulator